MIGKAENSNEESRSIFRIAAWSGAAFILLVPLVAMQFSDEVNWDLADFVVAGTLLAGVGTTFELAVRKSGNLAYRAAVGISLAAAFLLIWVSLAVGIIGSEENDANLLYFGVLAIGIIGAIIARFQPLGMARALFATAVAQASVAIVALAAGLGTTGPVWPRDILIPTVFFAALWAGSASLFWKAARQQLPASSGERTDPSDRQKNAR